MYSAMVIADSVFMLLLEYMYFIVFDPARRTIYEPTLSTVSILCELCVSADQIHKKLRQGVLRHV